VSEKWSPLGEAFDLIAATPVIEARAQERLPYLSRYLDITDAVKLETEDAMSCAGLSGALQFEGRQKERAKDSSIPTEWFEARARRWIYTPRGVEPDSNQLWFAPLHQEQDKNFDIVANFAAQALIEPERWFKVRVTASAGGRI
jgi:RES domain-containing protein